MPNNVKMTKMMAWWLQDKAIKAYPNEACGFILKKSNRILEVKNSSPTPHKAFKMSEQDLFDALVGIELTDIGAIWHTHPGKSPYPSETDKEAIRVGAIQPNWDYFIVTQDAVTEWPLSEILG